MNRLEDELRAMFAAQVASPPRLNDPVARVLARARTIRRRRLVFTGLAGALAVVLVVAVGDELLAGRRGVPATAPAGAVPAAAATTPGHATIRLDLRVGNELWTAAGRRLSLPSTGRVTWIYRVPIGWVYGDSGDDLRLLTSDGTAIDSGVPTDAVVVSPDGRRVAWASGAAGKHILVIGVLSGDGIMPTAKTQMVDQAVPVTFAGTGVVIGRTDQVGRISAYSLWNPDMAYRPIWDSRLVTVYRGAGPALVGLVAASDPAGPGPTGGCLAFYTASGDLLKQYATGPCGLGLVAGSTRGSRSPDGRWLVDQTPHGLIFVNLSSAGSPSGTPAAGPVRVGSTCAVQGRTAPVWEDGGAVLVATDLGLVRCTTTGSNDYITVPGLAGTDWDLVPALGT